MSQRIGSGKSVKVGDSGSTSVNNSRLVQCLHKKPCVVQTSGTDLNPSRKFYGCPYWKDPKKNCDYFRWVGTNGDDFNGHEVEATILKLEESIKRAQCKAERRKKEKQLVAEELINVMAVHDALLAESRSIKYDVKLNRYMLTILFIVNVMVLVVICSMK
ncbi:unnamed protein product [Linum trigynum]|uniref:GRF-type domain-containing protein n=1 Tax=Linum trigynum TaxID=586398 RepID=A0AAV2EPX7_9ROSI